MIDLTLVTGIWDLGRDRAGPGFERPFDHYRHHFSQLLQLDVPLVVFGDEETERFTREHRGARPTHFHLYPAERFRQHFPFYERVQELRQDPAWLAQSGWLPASAQATMELYNPMVMSKMFLLHDASIWNPFGTRHMAWIDGAITNTVHPGYFTRDGCLERILPLLRRFFFISFPYRGGDEIHGFSREGMRKFCGMNPEFVCRGGFFGGHVECFGEVNAHYYSTLGATLHDGFMGTEESVFTIMAAEEPDLYRTFQLEDDHAGLLLHFFEHAKTLSPVPPAAPASAELPPVPNHPGPRTVAGYVVTFQAPPQLEATLSSWTAQFSFDRLFVVDNSTDPVVRAENAELAQRFGAEILSHPNGNGGVCGARQLVAEHFEEGDLDFYVYIEDDMLLNPAAEPGLCPYGFRTSVPGLREAVVRIMCREGFDFLKLSFAEFFGHNGTQWAWYNVPSQVRLAHWPEHPRLPAAGLDPNPPSTRFHRIATLDGLSWAEGEVYYCNWPQIVSRSGNRKMFLDTVFEHPFEQTWMSHMYQLTVEGRLRPAVLLASVITHDRFQHYPGDERREN